MFIRRAGGVGSAGRACHGGGVATVWWLLWAGVERGVLCRGAPSGRFLLLLILGQPRRRRYFCVTLDYFRWICWGCPNMVQISFFLHRSSETSRTNHTTTIKNQASAASYPPTCRPTTNPHQHHPPQNLKKKNGTRPQ